MSHQKGDLVHIPQAVEMIECDGPPPSGEWQLTIPLRVKKTDSPQIGVVTDASSARGYARVFSQGTVWSVKNENLYALNEESPA